MKSSDVNVSGYLRTCNHAAWIVTMDVLFQYCITICLAKSFRLVGFFFDQCTL